MLAAIVLGAMLSTCSSPPSVLERILRSGELRVVTRNTPAAFYYGADEPRGIEYELARGYADKLGVSLRIYIDDQVFPDLVSGKAQIGAASLTVADARARQRDVRPRLPTDRAADRLSPRHAAAPQARATSSAAGSRSSRAPRTRPCSRSCGRKSRLLTWIEHIAALERGAHPPRRRGRDRLHRRGLASVRAAAPLLPRPARRVPARADGSDRVGVAEGRRAAARKHRGVLRGARGDRQAQADPRSLLLRVERVRLRRLARLHAPRQHAAPALSRLLPRGASARRASIGACSRPSPIKSRIGIPPRSPRQACAA